MIKIDATNKILKPKSNYVNTIQKYYNDEKELVKKLEFYNPLLFSKSNSKDRNSLFQMKKLSPPNVKVYDGRKSMKNITAPHMASSDNLDNFKSIVLPEIKTKSLNDKKINNAILEKNVYLKRMENLSIETKMENKRKQKMEELQTLKNERKSIIVSIIGLQKEIESNVAEIEFLSNFAKYTEFTGNRNIKKFEQLKNNKKTTNEDKEKFFLAVDQVQKDMYMREHKISELKLDNDNKLKIKNKLQDRSKEMKEKINKITEELNEIKTQLMLHYHTLLNEGRDTRQEGLIWIIKAIWNIGCNVLMSYMPNFLDENCIDYLFDAAHLEVELEKLKTKIEDLKMTMQISFAGQKNTKKVKGVAHFFKTLVKIEKSPDSKIMNTEDIFSRIHNDKNLIDNPENFNVKNTEEFLNKNEKLDENSLQLIGEIKELQSEYDKSKKEISNKRRSELDRIAKEFLVNDYGRRYNVSQDIVISAIVGEDNSNSELLRQTRDKKEYYEKLKICRNFNFLQDYSNLKASTTVKKLF